MILANSKTYYVLNTSILVKDQNTVQVNNNKSGASKPLLDNVMNDLYYELEFMEENTEQVQEIDITDVQENDKSYLVHLSSAQTLSLNNGN